MKPLYILIELILLALFTAEAVNTFKDKDKAAKLVIWLAAFMVTSGELFNNFFSKVTVYNPGYLLWVPGTDIPLFIICSGILVSLIIYKASCSFGGKFLQRLIPFIFICCFFPLIELGGIRTGLWSWPSNPAVSPGWLLGVWEFYFVAMGIPALSGIILSSILKWRSRRESSKM